METPSVAYDKRRGLWLPKRKPLSAIGSLTSASGVAGAGAFLAAGAAWDPTTPGNVVAWYFTSTTYCFEDDAGTDACENADGVAVFKNRHDESSNSVVQTTAGNRPTYESAGWNAAQPSVSFDGAGDVLQATTGSICTAIQGDDVAFTVFSTLQCTVGSVDQSIFCWDNSGGNEVMQIRTDNAGNNLLRVTRTDAAAGTAGQSGAALGTSRHRIAMYFAGTTVSTWIDGTLDLNAAALNVAALTTINRFRVGNGTTGSFTGRISEFVVYTGDKSSHVGSYQTYSSTVWGG